MGIYYVKTTVDWGGEVIADSAEEAEAMGWNWDTELMYEGVDSITVQVIDEDDDEDEAL
jgi:hypothetical protein